MWFGFLWWNSLCGTAFVNCMDVLKYISAANISRMTGYGSVLQAPLRAWMRLGIIDLLITWQACLGREQYGGAQFEPGFKLLYFAVTLASLIIALSAGGVSFRNWRELSRIANLSNAEGRGREEYMALIGVFVSFTLGIGIVWLGIADRHYRAVCEGEMKARAFHGLAVLLSCCCLPDARADKRSALRGRTGRRCAAGQEGNPGIWLRSLPHDSRDPCGEWRGRASADFFSRRTMIAGELPNTPENLSSLDRESAFGGTGHSHAGPGLSMTNRHATLPRTYTRCGEWS